VEEASIEEAPRSAAAVLLRLILVFTENISLILCRYLWSKLMLHRRV